jgi:hypothetical protein
VYIIYMASTNYQSEFLNNLRVVGSVTSGIDINNASLQTNTLGVSIKAVIQDLDVSANASLGGNLNVVGTSTLASTTMDSSSVTNNASVGGALSVVGASTLAGTTMSSASVTNNASVGGTLSVVGASTLAGTTMDSASVTNDASVGGALSVTGQSSLSNTTIQGNAVVNGNTTLNGNVLITGALSNVLDRAYNVQFAGGAEPISSVVVTTLNSSYAFGAFFILVDESNDLYLNSVNDGAAAIFSSCTNTSSSIVNRISGVDGVNAGRVDISWDTSGGNGVLNMTITRAVDDTTDRYFVVRIMSPTRLFNPLP